MEEIEKLKEEKDPREKMRTVGDMVIEAASDDQDDSSGDISDSDKIEEALEETPETRFKVDPKEFDIFSRQGEYKLLPGAKKYSKEPVGIDETLGRMVGATAATVATLVGENGDIPAADHVIYLDKSARPVSWLVDEFWDEFTDKKRPEKSYLAIDRKSWFPRAGVELQADEYVEEPDGSRRVAEGRDFDVNKIPEEMIARIRALYIAGGIDSDETSEENVKKIMEAPTVLDGKKITIIDEVSRSGSTIEIAQQLLRRAFPKAQVSGYVFWKPGTFKIETGEDQMMSSPAWYPHDKSDWRGRGVRDVDEKYYSDEYANDPTSENRARKFGAFVLGVPLVNKEDEPGQLSWKLAEDIRKMHEEYKKGHILPSFPSDLGGGEVEDRLYEQVESWGVEFVPEKEAKGNSRAYITLASKRDGK